VVGCHVGSPFTDKFGLTVKMCHEYKLVRTNAHACMFIRWNGKAATRFKVRPLSTISVCFFCKSFFILNFGKIDSTVSFTSSTLASVALEM
jgi:hypothetical protein